MRQLSNERCSHSILLTLSRIKTNIALSYLSSCNWSRTQNHLVRKRTLNHFGQTMVDSLWNAYVTWQEHTVYHISLTLKFLSSQPEQEICKLFHVLAVFFLHKWKALREKCPSVQIRTEYRKIRTTKNSIFGHFSYNDGTSLIWPEKEECTIKLASYRTT